MDTRLQIILISVMQMFLFQAAVWIILKRRFDRRRNMMWQEMERVRRRRIRKTITKVLLLTTQRKRRKCWEKPKSSHWWEATVPKFDDDKWLENFRVRKGAFQYLCNKVEPILSPSPHPVIPNRSLSVEKNCSYSSLQTSSCGRVPYKVVGNQFGVHKSTVHNCLYAFCLALIHVLGVEYIKMPNEAEAQEIAKSFEQVSHIPQIIGAIDGCHIPVTSPEDGRSDFLNRKMFSSIVLQAIVDNQFCIRDISCKLPGSCHDADVLRESDFYKNLDSKMPKGFKNVDGMDIPFLIIGDPAYPLLPWLIKNYTYDANTTQKMDSFNVHLNKARIVVENAFGRLKGRWRILLKRSEVDYTFIPKVVAACCILHNICEASKETFNTTWLGHVEDAERAYPVEEPVPFDSENVPDAVDVRDHLMLYLSRNFEILTSIRGRIAAM